VAANLAYEERFGHIYLVCATGLSGEQMLANLAARMDNDPATELRVVNRELTKIAALRLRKVVA
jgi:2-oxo-4-hydroxy-4-carboxy-5-ureidoimidazoline decarboxylase